MKNILTITMIIRFISFYSFAQAPDTLWTKVYGNSYANSAKGIIKVEDGFLVVGRFQEWPTRVWISKINEDGDTLWNKNYTAGGSALDILQLTENEFIVSAETFTQGSLEDMMLLKIDSNGDTIWTKTFFYPSSDYIRDVKIIDNNIVILGYSENVGPQGARLIKVNQNGDTSWTKFYPFETFNTRPTSLELDNDTGLLFLVQTRDSTILNKTDSLGNIIWKNRVSTAPYFANKIIKTEDENYFLLGYYNPNSDTTFIWISLLSGNFEIIWSHIYLSTSFETPTSMIRSNTGGYLIIGNSAEFISSNDGLIMKINNAGETIWKKSYGGISSDYFNDILILSNNEFIVVGSTSSFGAGDYDAWLLKFSADTLTTSVKEIVESDLPTNFDLSQNYPNPFNPSTKISWQLPVGSWQTLKVYDVLGNEIATLVDEYKPAGTYEVEWNASKYPSGVYFYQLRAEGFVEIKKMILMK